MVSFMNSFCVRVLTVDGVLVAEERDFASGAEWDVFGEMERQSLEDEVVQLVDESSGRVLAEAAGVPRKMRSLGIAI